MGGCLGLGLIQIICGQAVSLYMSVKKGDILGGILDNVPWWIFYALLALGVLGYIPILYAIVISLALLLLTQGHAKPTIMGKIIGGFAGIYNIINIAADAMSYSRIMALMLAGGIIANVFNSIAAMLGPFAFWIVFIIGHLLNLGLNLIGTYVHDMRLQCLEFFGKFYKDGGQPFKPLSVKAKDFTVTD